MVIGLGVIGVVVLGVAIWTVFGAGATTYEVIVSPEALTTVLDETEYLTEGSSEIIVMDLRDREDYQKSHLSNAINIPYDDDGVNLLGYLERKSYQNKPIYLMCYSGKRSGIAFNLLKEANFKNLHYISFGFEDYKEAINDNSSFATGKCPCELEEYYE